jgi:rare lipoprotein A (peptidoglycan hydrolase)
MVGLVLAAMLTLCSPAPADYDKGWASWYGSPLKGYSNYNNPWYTRGKDKILNFAAVKSFKWGDAPYNVEVCSKKTGICVIARVVDRCTGCVGKRLIDLSPILFKDLGLPLHFGVMKVTVRRLNGDQRSSYRCSAQR